MAGVARNENLTEARPSSHVTQRCKVTWKILDFILQEKVLTLVSAWHGGKCGQSWSLDNLDHSLSIQQEATQCRWGRSKASPYLLAHLFLMTLIQPLPFQKITPPEQSFSSFLLFQYLLFPAPSLGSVPKCEQQILRFSCQIGRSLKD